MTDQVKQEGDSFRDLMSAAVLGNIEAMNALLAQGADVNTPSPSGMTPLMFAARFGRTDMVRLLCGRGASLVSEDKRGENALQYAAERGHSEITWMLLEAGAELSDYTRPEYLLMAILSGHFDTVKAFLDRGADPNARDSIGNPALEYAIMVGGVEAGDERIVRLLLERGADINGRGYNERTALMEAARFSNVQMVKLLLEEGADVNATSRTGETALSHARCPEAYSVEENASVRATRAEAVTDLLSRAGAHS